MDIIEAICIAVPIGLIVGAAVAIGIAKLLKRERQALPYVGPATAYDAEPYPRYYE